MKPEVSREELEVLDKAYRKASSNLADAMSDAWKIRDDVFSKLRQIRSEEDESIFNTYREAIIPAKKLLREARERRSEAYAKNAPYIEYKEKARRLVNRLFILASLLAFVIVMCVFPILDNLVLNLLSIVPYVAWLLWLNKQTDLQIVNGALFTTNAEASV